MLEDNNLTFTPRNSRKPPFLGPILTGLISQHMHIGTHHVGPDIMLTVASQIILGFVLCLGLVLFPLPVCVPSVYRFICVHLNAEF